MKRGYTYILLCSDNSYYTGSTVHIERRLAQHQNGEGANYTRKRRPVKLVYIEEHPTIRDAFYREKQIQGWNKAKKEALINNDLELLIRLSKSSDESGHSTSSVTGHSTSSVTGHSTSSVTGHSTSLS